MLSVIDPDKIEVRVIDSLQKIFMDDKPLTCPQLYKISVLKGETASFQIAYRYLDFYSSSQMLVQAPKNPNLNVAVVSEIKDLVQIRKVGYVPSTFPCYTEHDDNYITTLPGLFPDVLEEIKGSIAFIPYQWRSLWVDVEIPNDYQAGTYDIEILYSNLEGEVLKKNHIEVEIIDAVLPPQRLIHTEWLYCDCIADYYEVPVFSEEFWETTSNFIQTAVKRGVNMILTPVFTPPLDTYIGKERTTVQLVAVEVKNGTYHFSFEQFERFVSICKESGVSYYEISHLFSQWGAKYAPKIIAKEDGVEKQIFGWHTKGCSEEYREFLHAFLPALIEQCKKLEIDKQLYFHISDEPNDKNLDTYQQAKEMVDELLKDYPVIDALSNLEFHLQKLVKYPVPTNVVIHDFLEAGMEHPWVYYCSGENVKVSNRYFSMPSARNRIIGIQMYKYGIEGFLHWGYNFYNSQYSLQKINPYQITDALDTFPSGDSFLVYPGKNKECVESLRLMVFYEALCDMRAFALLEELTDKKFVIDLIERYADEPITFSDYPKSAAFILQIREEVNQEIKKRIGRK